MNERACLDIPGDAEGGRLVVVADYLKSVDRSLWSAVLTTLAQGRPYRSINGAWSLTPLKESAE
jgi:hypothetical protein